MIEREKTILKHPGSSKNSQNWHSYDSLKVGKIEFFSLECSKNNFWVPRGSRGHYEIIHSRTVRSFHFLFSRAQSLNVCAIVRKDSRSCNEHVRNFRSCKKHVRNFESCCDLFRFVSVICFPLLPLLPFPLFSFFVAHSKFRSRLRVRGCYSFA